MIESKHEDKAALADSSQPPSAQQEEEQGSSKPPAPRPQGAGQGSCRRTQQPVPSTAGGFWGARSNAPLLASQPTTHRHSSARNRRINPNSSGVRRMLLPCLPSPGAGPLLSPDAGSLGYGRAQKGLTALWLFVTPGRSRLASPTRAAEQLLAQPGPAGSGAAPRAQPGQLCLRPRACRVPSRTPQQVKPRDARGASPGTPQHKIPHGALGFYPRATSELSHPALASRPLRKQRQKPSPAPPSQQALPGARPGFGSSAEKPGEPPLPHDPSPAPNAPSTEGACHQQTDSSKRRPSRTDPGFHQGIVSSAKLSS